MILLPTLALAMALTGDAKAPVPPAAPAPAASQSLSFRSETQTYYWDRLIPLHVEVDGLKVNSIFFNVRESTSRFFKGAQFGTRAQVEITNTGKVARIPGLAVAVLDAEGNLLGVASGGTKVGSLAPGETETFDLNFTHVKERLPKGAKFILSLELKD